MVVWSAIAKRFSQKSLSSALLANKNLICSKSKAVVFNQTRHSGHGPKEFIIKASDWQWDKFKDLVHFYVLVGAIPITVLLVYTNVFIGPATLAPIPEGYEPKHWEYHKHPVSRFIAKYIVPNPQQEYEKMCHQMYESQESNLLRKLHQDVKAKIAERQDYQAWYYRPALVKYARQSKKYFEEHTLSIGD